MKKLFPFWTFCYCFFFVTLNATPSLLRAHRACCLPKCAFLTLQSWISLSSHCVVQNQSAPVPFCCKAELLRCIIWKFHCLPPSGRWRSEGMRLHIKLDNYWYFTLASSIAAQRVVGMIQIKAVSQKVCHHTLDSVLELEDISCVWADRKDHRTEEGAYVSLWVMKGISKCIYIFPMWITTFRKTLRSQRK